MKIRDIKTSNQINEVDLSSFIGGRGAAAVRGGDQSTEDRMAMDIFLKKFIGNASQAVNQAVNSGLVVKGATASATATADQPNAAAGTSAPAAANVPTAQAQTVTQSPDEIRKQKLATNATAAQKQMAANPVQAKAAPAVAKSPEQIRQEKLATNATAAQKQMAPVSKLPANQPAVQASNIRQQKQAAATDAIQGQAAPFSKVTPKPAVWSNKRNPNASPRSPIVKQNQSPATQAEPTTNFKGPRGYNKPTTNAPGFNAQNVMPKKKIASIQEPVTAESIRFSKLNNLFENMMYEEENKQSISQYIVGFYKKFMQGKKMDQAALQSSIPQAISLSKEAEASYPKMNGPLTKLAQLGWAVSQQQGETPDELQSVSSVDSALQSSSSTKIKTVYAQVKGMLDKLDTQDKQRILTALTKQLGSTPVKTTNEPISVGGQKINPTDPLYAKMQKQMAGK